MSPKRAIILGLVTITIGLGQVLLWNRLPLLPHWFSPELFWMNYISLVAPWTFVVILAGLAGWISANLHLWLPVATWLAFVMAMVGGRAIAERIGGKNLGLIRLLSVSFQNILFFFLLWFFTSQLQRLFPASTPLPIFVWWQYGLPITIVHTSLLTVWSLRRRPDRQGHLI